MTWIFEITPAQISQLDDIHLSYILSRLLRAEAEKYDIPLGGIDTNVELRAPDGGIDACISWTGEPARTNFITGSPSGYQVKAGKLGPDDWGREVKVKRKKQLKPGVKELIENKGIYVAFSNQILGKQSINLRVQKIEEAIRDLGEVALRNDQVTFLDANKIASWVNCYIGIAARVRELDKISLAGFYTWDRWSQLPDHTSTNFISSEQTDELHNTLRDALSKPRVAVRLTGLSGYGKTRAALEAFRHGIHDQEKTPVPEQVVYRDVSADSSGLTEAIASLSNTGESGIIVVDNCPRALHDALLQHVTTSTSNLSLLSIFFDTDTSIPNTLSIKMHPSPEEVIVEILKNLYPTMAEPELKIIARIAQGFPKMAVMMGKARLSNDPEMAHLKDRQLIERLLWQGGSRNDEEYKAISALAIFEKVCFDQVPADEYKFVADNVALQNPEEFFKHVMRFNERGIVERRGRYFFVSPLPLSLHLAATWWKECSPERAKSLVSGEMPGALSVSLCDRMAKLDSLPEAQELVKELCGPFAPFGQAEVLNSKKGSRLFRSFVEVNPEACAAALDRAFGGKQREYLLEVKEGRRDLVWALEKLSFREETFFIAARVLMEFATAENEMWSNNATGIFEQLFQPLLSGTQTPAIRRLDVLDTALSEPTPERLELVIAALGSALTTWHYSRMGGAEEQGAGPPLQDWRPTYYNELFEYWDAALERLTSLAVSNLAVAERARNEIAGAIRGLVRYGRLASLDKALNQVAEGMTEFWSKAYEELLMTLRYDSEKIPEEGVEQIHKWLDLVEPHDGEARLTFAVSKTPYDYLDDEESGELKQRHLRAFRELVEEISVNPDAWTGALKKLVVGEQRRGFQFGKELAEKTSKPKAIWNTWTDELKRVEKKEANPTALAGFISGLSEVAPQLAKRLLDEVLGDDSLGHFLVEISPRPIKTPEDLRRIEVGIGRGLIDESHAVNLSYGRGLDQISSQVVFDFCRFLAGRNAEGAWSSLEIIVMWQHGNRERWVHAMGVVAEILTSPNLRLYGDKERLNTRNFYHWCELSKRLLKERRDERLATHLVCGMFEAIEKGRDGLDADRYFSELFEFLLAEYLDAAWPIVRNRLEHAKGVQALILGHVFKGSSSTERFALMAVPDDKLLAWCRESPKRAPKTLAGLIPILEDQDGKVKWTPIAKAVIDEFGQDEDVLSAVTGNLLSFTWSGSLVPFYARLLNAFQQLVDHDSPEVKKWARAEVNSMRETIKAEEVRDQEREIGVYR